mmetsp:Transcript_40081/g.111412  ORF Transcript_40081/g.111412 Transcript_40081/m.111412 type:complete len:207 (-) Transcript_40081:1612-2232(-)
MAVACLALHDGVELAHGRETKLPQLSEQVGLLLPAELQLALHNHEDETSLVTQDLLLAFHLGDQVGLPLVVNLEAQAAEVSQDVQCGAVLGDPAVSVEEHHVGKGYGRLQFEGLLQSRLLHLTHPFRRERKDKVHSALSVILAEFLDRVARLLVGFPAIGRHELLKKLLVVLGPGLHWKFCDLERGFALLLHGAHDIILALVVGHD